MAAERRMVKTLCRDCGALARSPTGAAAAARLVSHATLDTVTLKLKTADFRLRTRSRRLSDPTQLAETLFRTIIRCWLGRRTASPGFA
jgi:nucleotidyltransferase/DNA polymerase involved in DNA repair